MPSLLALSRRGDEEAEEERSDEAGPGKRASELLRFDARYRSETGSASNGYAVFSACVAREERDGVITGGERGVGRVGMREGVLGSRKRRTCDTPGDRPVGRLQQEAYAGACPLQE